MVERLWQLKRLGAGDYLLPSNDRLTLWRIVAYDEDGSATRWNGREWKPLVGKRWALWRLKDRYAIRDSDGRVVDVTDPDALDSYDWRSFWDDVAGPLDTRAEAIEYAVTYS